MRVTLVFVKSGKEIHRVIKKKISYKREIYFLRREPRVRGTG